MHSVCCLQAVQAQVNLLKLKQRIESENKRRAHLNKYLAEISNGEATEAAEPKGNLADWEKRVLQVVCVIIID